ncbi:acylneuraminate cytidylyltransferase family protein [Pedobacter sp. SD-b]|uniref:Acylneuraminate cytidylyltransferase family protein n=1 Tax=Pedobacter segetis TaxID=2793069 RepID=A0ABS1BI93_9SPHI|nr:acylneuraminate cytidylyltransferase family protein [Pedobacter segetis]MBK0382076.1 acylneuraminate cytidylyltransferase family protein [Pedobacter segetis]
MRSLVVIPARGGSKGIPHKNIKLLNGKPLIHYTIEVARTLFNDEDICVSTEDEFIIKVVEEIGLKVPFKRPLSLATDHSSTYDVLLHALHHYENIQGAYDTIILMQPTSPFRTATHLEEALALYQPAIEMVVSVFETAANPYFVLFEDDSKGFLVKSKSGQFNSRQECPKVWQYNGAIYIINAKALKKRSHLQFERVIKYEMEEANSIDLDTPLDWEFAEFLLQKK